MYKRQFLEFISCLSEGKNLMLRNILIFNLHYHYQHYNRRRYHNRFNSNYQTLVNLFQSQHPAWSLTFLVPIGLHLMMITHSPVSYTHLDVYKRQGILCNVRFIKNKINTYGYVNNDV